MSRIKTFLDHFPTQPATVVAAIVVFLLMGFAASIRLLLGKDFPDGYDAWIWAVLIAMGVGAGYGIGKRLSHIDYKAAGTSPVNVEAPSTVTVTAETTVKPKAQSEMEGA